MPIYTALFSLSYAIIVFCFNSLKWLLCHVIENSLYNFEETIGNFV